MPKADLPEANLTDLEASIKQVEGVLGCAILVNPTRAAYEIHAFTRTGVDSAQIEAAIAERAEVHSSKDLLSRIFLFELDAGSAPNDRGVLRRADDPQPGGKRPLLVRVSPAPSIGRSIAGLALEGGAGRVADEATGELTPHGLELLAEGTLDAVANLLGLRRFTSGTASLVELGGQGVVVVVVDEREGPQLVGAALVREGSITETAVRATLDAINRRLERGL